MTTSRVLMRRKDGTDMARSDACTETDSAANTLTPFDFGQSYSDTGSRRQRLPWRVNRRDLLVTDLAYRLAGRRSISEHRVGASLIAMSTSRVT